MPRDIPVIFSKPMVLALLDGRKTMTRRLAWRPYRCSPISKEVPPTLCRLTGFPGSFVYSPWRNVQAGDRLWVRESITQSGALVAYMAGGPSSHHVWPKHWRSGSRPSIHMPRVFSRLTLIITETKIERLQAITAVDAFSEGFPPIPGHAGAGASAQEWFSALWSGLHGVESWRDNPEVVALSFRVIRANIDAPEAKVA